MITHVRISKYSPWFEVLLAPDPSTDMNAGYTSGDPSFQQQYGCISSEIKGYNGVRQDGTSGHISTL
jgi:hypothetical protein